MLLEQARKPVGEFGFSDIFKADAVMSDDNGIKSCDDMYTLVFWDRNWECLMVSITRFTTICCCYQLCDRQCTMHLFPCNLQYQKCHLSHLLSKVSFVSFTFTFTFAFAFTSTFTLTHSLFSLPPVELGDAKCGDACGRLGDQAVHGHDGGYNRGVLLLYFKPSLHVKSGQMS